MTKGAKAALVGHTWTFCPRSGQAHTTSLSEELHCLGQGPGQATEIYWTTEPGIRLRTKGNIYGLVVDAHLKKAHDDSHGGLVIAIAGGGGGGGVVFPGVERPLHDLVAQGHVVPAIVVVSLPLPAGDQIDQVPSRNVMCIKTCFAPAVAVVSLFGCSNKHLLLLGFALALGPVPGLDFDPDPGRDVGLERLWKPCIHFSL